MGGDGCGAGEHQAAPVKADALADLGEHQFVPQGVLQIALAKAVHLRGQRLLEQHRLDATGHRTGHDFVVDLVELRAHNTSATGEDR